MAVSRMRGRPAHAPGRVISARFVVLLAAGAAGLAALTGCGVERLPSAPPAPTGPPIRIVFASNRPPATIFTTDVYFYDADLGGEAFMPPNLNSTLQEQVPGISHDGEWLSCLSNRGLIGTLAQLLLYEVDTGVITLPALLNALNTPVNPSLSGDGRYLAVNYQAGGGVFDQFVTIADLVADTVFTVPNLNEFGATTFDPWLSEDATLLACASNGTQSVGAFDILLYSVPNDAFIPLPGLNSAQNDLSPSLSADGRYLAFQSGRAGGAGLIDVYVYDTQTQTFLPTPGLNTPLSEIQPALSPDGRYLVCTTESEGAGDIRLYDLQTQVSLPTPGLNHPYFREDTPVIARR